MLFTICLLPLEDQFLEILTLFHSFSSSLHQGWHSGTSLSNQRNEINRNRGEKAEGAKVRAFKKLAQGHPNGHTIPHWGPVTWGHTDQEAQSHFPIYTTARIHLLPSFPLHQNTVSGSKQSFSPTVLPHSGGDTCE